MTDHHHHHHHAQCAARIALPTRVATSTSSTTTTLTTSTSSTTAAKAAAAADMHNNDPTTTKDDEDDVRQSADDDQHRHHQRRKYQHQTSEASAPSVGPTCGFYKFLAWFSGESIFYLLPAPTLILCLCLCVCVISPHAPGDRVNLSFGACMTRPHTLRRSRLCLAEPRGVDKIPFPFCAGFVVCAHTDVGMLTIHTRLTHQT